MLIWEVEFLCAVRDGVEGGMNALFRFISSWLFTIIMTWQFVYGDIYGWINLGNNPEIMSQAVVAFETIKPAVYRTIIPLVAKFITLFSIHPFDALAFTIFLSGLAAYLSIRKLFSLYIPKPDIYALLCIILTHWLIMYNRSYYDLGTVFFFCLAYYLLASDKVGYYLLLFPVIALHRETSILLIGVFFLLYYNRMGIILFIKSIAFQVLTWVSIRAVLEKIFKNNRGSDIHFHHDVTGAYLQMPWMLITLLIVIAILLLARRNWNKYPKTLQVFFVLFPIQILLHLIVGYPFEFRLLAESFPVVFLMCVYPLIAHSCRPAIRPARA